MKEEIISINLKDKKLKKDDVMEVKIEKEQIVAINSQYLMEDNFHITFIKSLKNNKNNKKTYCHLIILSQILTIILLKI